MNTENTTPDASTKEEEFLAGLAAALADDSTGTQTPAVDAGPSEDYDDYDEAELDYDDWVMTARYDTDVEDDAAYESMVQELAEPLPVLDDEHVEFLALERIDAATAVQHGTRTARHRADLPKSLRSVWDGKGILFTHTRLDGTTVPQYRPDTPTIRGSNSKIVKYWFPKGAGSSPYISPLQKSLVGRSRRTWIIEGTKAFLAIVSMLVATGRANDILAVCFPGCTAARKEGVYDDTLADLIPAGSIATIFFDADVATNPNVNRMGAELQSHIEIVCLSEARFAKTTASNKAGVSDWIGGMTRRSDLEVMNILLGVEDKALKKLPRIAAAARKTVRVADATTSANGVKVNWLDECISKPFTDDSGKTHLGEKLLDGAAIRLKAAYEVYDDLADEQVRLPMFDLEVKTGGQVHELLEIDSAYLNEPRRLLSMLPNAVGETISVKPRMGEEIGEAIRVSAGRAGAELPVKRKITRTGWFTRDEKAADGTTKPVTRFVAINGAIGPHDFAPDMTGSIEEKTFAKFSVENPHDYTKEEHIEAVRDVLRVSRKFLVDPAPWIVGHGFMAMTACGITNLGGLVIVGAPRSGKSHLVQGLGSMQVPGWNDPANFENTKTYVADMGKGCEHVTVMVDDLRYRKANSRAGDDQGEGFEAIMRRVYEGAGRTRGRKEKNMVTQRFEQGAKMTNSPGFILSAENSALPDGVDPTGEVNSNMTRALFTQVTYASTFRPGTADEFQDLAESRAFHIAHMGFIAHQAWVFELQGYEKHVATLKDLSKSWAEDLAEMFPGLENRSYKIGANSLTGRYEFLAYAAHIGAIDSAEEDRERKVTLETIGRVMHESWDNFQGGSKGDTPLGRIVNAVLTGTYRVDGLNDEYNPNARRLGKAALLEDGTPVVHIFTTEAQKITGMTPKALGNSLKAVLHPNAGQTFTRKVSFDGGTAAPCYSISREAWSGKGWAADEAAHDEAQGPY